MGATRGTSGRCSGMVGWATSARRGFGCSIAHRGRARSPSPGGPIGREWREVAGPLRGSGGRRPGRPLVSVVPGTPDRQPGWRDRPLRHAARSAGPARDPRQGARSRPLHRSAPSPRQSRPKEDTRTVIVSEFLPLDRPPKPWQARPIRQVHTSLSVRGPPVNQGSGRWKWDPCPRCWPWVTGCGRGQGGAPAATRGRTTLTPARAAAESEQPGRSRVRASGPPPGGMGAVVLGWRVRGGAQPYLGPRTYGPVT